MQSVIFHISHSSINNFHALFSKMFPYSKIALSVELERTKTGYIINHGVAPYFKDKLEKNLLQDCLSRALK